MSAPLEMNPEIRARWTAALRSGEIPQTQGYLARGDGRCCLGVLCDLAEKAGVITSESDPNGTWRNYAGRRDYLPLRVVAWAGLSDSNPDTTEGPLGFLNDRGWDFPRIADVIDGGAA